MIGRSLTILRETISYNEFCRNTNTKTEKKTIIVCINLNLEKSTDNYHKKYRHIIY
jgi:hypothetical protein